MPAGRYARPRICDEENLQRVAAGAAAVPVLSVDVCSFEAALASAGRGDFIYLDPPYAPLSVTARFTAYTAGGFDQAQQERLQSLVVSLAERGAAVLLSNSAAPRFVRFTRATVTPVEPGSSPRL